MICQSLFTGENKENIMNVLSVESIQLICLNFNSLSAKQNL